MTSQAYIFFKNMVTVKIICTQPYFSIKYLLGPVFPWYQILI